MLTSTVYGLVLALAIFAQPVQAAETPATHFTPSLIADGSTLKLEDNASVAVWPKSLPAEADVTWTISEAAVPAVPSQHDILDHVYRLTISGVSALTTGTKPLAILLPGPKSTRPRQIWMYDQQTKVWTTLKTGRHPSGLLQAGTTSLDGLYAVVEDSGRQQGYASWYCRYHCSAKYPKLHGTSNDYPVGSYVTVTNPVNNLSVNVKIVSGWGQPAGRVIDLSYAAFAALKPKNTGVTLVTLRPAGATVSPTTTATTEMLPKLTVTQTNLQALPNVPAVAYVVYDQTTGTTLASKNADTVRPVASLTKLVTAMVALDQAVPMTKVMTYSRVDRTPYAYLQVNYGEQLKVKDLFYSLLVGSANNAATTLARSTGLTRAQFVAKMNAKVASWGLTHSNFVDVSGLDIRNTSSAGDMAIIAGHAFHDYPLIKAASLARSYSFTTLNTKHSHTIKSTDTLLTKGSSLNITGGKTGYLDEAQYTYALRTANPQGAQVVTVVLGAPSSSQRFSAAAQLAHWAWDGWTWS